MSGIRVTYTGLISLIGGIISIFTGIIFTLIITRSVTAEEYGTWGLILALITYVSLIGPIVSYWSTRDTARNIQSGKTAILSSILLSIGAVSIYILISYLMGNYTNVEKQIIKILDTKIKPAVAKDGGDIKFKEFKNGVVTVQLQGSCSGCPSSIMTLKQGVQNLMCHYIPEVKSVEAI